MALRAARILAVVAVLAVAAIVPTGVHAQVKPFGTADARLAAQALAAANSGDTARALSLRSATRDSVAAKLIAWYALSRRDASADVAEIAAFLRDNPHWPAPALLRQTFERSISASTGADHLLAWFADSNPQSYAALHDSVAALLRQRKVVEAAALLRRAWPRIRLTEAQEDEVLRHHGKMLHSVHHADRIGDLAALGLKSQARRLLSQVTIGPAHKLLVEARLMLRDEAYRYDHRPVLAALASVPAAERLDQGLLYDHMRWARRTGRASEAYAILGSLPLDLAESARWWKEIEILIRRALQARQFAAAYDMARRHRQRGGEPLIEAEFLAGFIAFRFLNRNDDAEKHFAAIEAEKPPTSELTRTAYWLGRLAEARRDRARALQHYTRAASAATTFYGQLAAAKLDKTQLALDPGEVTAAAAKRFAEDELVRSAHLLRALGDRQAARLFALRAMLLGNWHTALHTALEQFVLDLTLPAHREQTAVRVAKLAARDGASMSVHGYPTLDLPEDNTVEPGLVFAVIRQESEFQPIAKSYAGARGLMQLMPFTARKEAADLRLPYALERLTADPAYNLRLGTAHLARLRAIYEGSYPPIIAAYNAGADRVDLWLTAFGDPRQGRIDWVDWIELIPFEETRLYTKFVLENYAVYRARLGDPVELPKLAEQWRAPKPDLEACKVLLAKIEPSAAPLAGNAAGSDRHAATKRSSAIHVLRKEKADNRPGTPAC